jgi:hypothetical protein
VDWIFPEGERGWAGVDEINMEAAARDLGTYHGQSWGTIEILRQQDRRRQLKERKKGEEKVWRREEWNLLYPSNINILLEGDRG